MIIGIDGEGQGRIDHKYIMMGANDEKGKLKKTIESKEGEGLTTIECLDFLLSLPPKARIFSFSFNYDLTMMLKDLTNQSLYLLFRPELRQRSGKEAVKGPYPVAWKKYRLNLQGTKFTVSHKKHKIVVWDLFKFFQCKFVNALRDWKIGTPELWERMTVMKDKRSEFDKETRENIRRYMLEECKCMAELARKLIQSHEKVGLKLTTFYGAGSSGGAMLKVMGIKEKIVSVPTPMKDGVASAFFGGRFENSVIGVIDGPVYNYDISSAYPYHTTFLPCLVHGHWKHVNKRHGITDCVHALVSYRLNHNKSRFSEWGPFPFRDEQGSIAFPIESGGGWVWRDEYLAGEKLFPNVEFIEAWVYEKSCECKPFADIPKYYVHRLALGKEGPGIVIKLAVNSVYGKLAQSVGNAIFNSWIWAGIITSGCRAQILDVLGLHKDRKNLLMVATDGVFSREKLNMPLPKDTRTQNAVDPNGRPVHKPLGGWEEKVINKGIFVARPGVYFPLSPSIEELKDVRGRGVGKSVILNNWERIIEIWKKDGVNAVATVQNVSRFCGAKTSIHKSQLGYSRANARDGKSPGYGRWIERRVEMSFDPMPKRECINPDGMTLKLRKFPLSQRSMPYSKALVSRETAEIEAFKTELEEQPNNDFAEF